MAPLHTQLPGDRPDILGMEVTPSNYEHASDTILEWAASGAPRYVCVSNVHMVMETVDDAEFAAVVNNADFVTTDGMPLVWMLHRIGFPDASRVYGPELVLRVCEKAATNGIPIALYGGTEESLDRFTRFLGERFPGIRVVCAIAPPFRPLTPEEDESYTAQLSASGARIVFVGIGCPKQERWMAAHSGRLNATLIGVGAAFDFHSGAVRQAPPVMQRAGLEWLFRLAMEPRRLWKRYLKHNPRFMWRAGKAILRHQLTRVRTA